MYRAMARSLGWYVGVCVTTIVMLILLLKLWKADWRIPFVYSGDALLFLTWIQAAVEHGWYLTNPRLGAPFVQQMHDFPLVDGLHFAAIKLLAHLGLGVGGAYNVYYLLGYPLAALTATFVLRRLAVHPACAAVLGILYAFLPYHFIRNEGHLFLSSYYLVPIQVLAVMRTYQGRAIVFGQADSLWRMQVQGWRPIVAWLVFCLISASAGVYYAFFTCFFLLLSGFAGAIQRRSLAPVVATAVFVVAICSGVLLNVVPTLAYQAEHGPNAEAIHRTPAGAETYALKLTHLVLPISGHRVRRLADFRQWYDGFQDLNESITASLGLFGAATLLALLGRFFVRRFSSAGPDESDFLAFLLLGGMGLALVGCFGSLFALLVSDRIRGYNRISVFLSFFVFIGFGWFLTWLQTQATSFRSRCAFAFGLVVILGVGLFDQSSPGYVPRFAPAATAWNRDQEYYGRIEEALPANAMVFQFPPIDYPEPVPVNHHCPYDFLAGVMHTKSIRWSYGAVKGRYASLWQREACSLPPAAFVHHLALAGFDAILVDTALCKPTQLAFAKQVAELLNVTPLSRSDGRYQCYSLLAYHDSIRNRYTESDRDHVLQPILPTWPIGFYPVDHDRSPNLRWCSHRGTIMLHNPSSRTKTVELSFSIDAPGSEKSVVALRGLLHEQVALSPVPTKIVRTVELPPGRSEISLACNAKPIIAPRDPRCLVFRVTDFQLRDPSATLTMHNKPQSPSK